MAAPWCARPPACELISNVCRHRQALILQGRGSLLTQQPGSAAGNLVCPLHRWTYSGGDASTQAGTLLGAPHFAQDPCLNLDNYPLAGVERPVVRAVEAGAAAPVAARTVTVAADLARLGPIADLDFSGHVLDHVELHECDYNWKTFIEVYLEDYHVGPFHPGLGSFVTCEDLRWEFGSNYCVQTVGVANRLGKAGSPVYERWQEALLQLPRRQAAEIRRDLAHLLPAHHGRVVSACADRLHAVSRRDRRRRSTWSSSTTRKKSPHSSATSSRRSRPPTWRPASRTTRSPCAWTPAAAH